MEAKEKAKELVEKIEDAIRDNTEATHMDSVVEDTFKAAKAVALIAVDEILNISYFIHEPSEDDELYRNYWQHVKEEIPKLKSK